MEKKRSRKGTPRKESKKILNKGLFTSKTDLWSTPQGFYENLNNEFAFDLDVCAFPENAKCERYFTPNENGLNQEWRGTCWMNPPYGREIDKWVRKAYESALVGATVVCLLPARTDTKWWHEYCMRAEIRLVRGRLKFGDGKSPAPFPSAVVIFRNHPKPSNTLIAM